ncbi:hypothetical protein F895_02011 [Acinetobacter sp. CIP 64.2]|uniref:sulfite exporter TauE/SafE family protein n=1 Tax=unclassified Acinetobacter TaxID=196816 RepID=UPI000288C111|nr:MULTISPECIES: sulfite exporter TauE/SafE family protein [unclassified Acinetobacter]ENX15465.1 hypothetical protein F895_02011 [Acinetobacter sp. CIP 64.2]
MNFEVITVISLAVLLGAFIQATCGMGFALIVVPVISLLNPVSLPVTVLLLMLPLNAYVAWREWSVLDKTGAVWIGIGRFMGTFGGIAILSVLSMKSLSIFIGLSTIFAAVVTWFIPPFNPNKKAYISAGLITGITETTTGIGGPPLALTYQYRPVAEMRATIAISFLFGEIISLIFLAISGHLFPELIYSTLWFLPALILGSLLSQFIHNRINQKYMRLFVQIFALSSSALLIIKALSK